MKALIEILLKNAGYESVEAYCNMMEITATEWSDTGDTEIVKDYMLSAHLIREIYNNSL